MQDVWVVSTLGWLSYLPFIERLTKLPDHQGYSLATLIDQFFWIINYKAEGPGNIIGVAKATRDQIVRYDKTEAYFSDVKIAPVDSEHGNTLENADKYNDALDEILQEYWARKQAQDD